jgi:large subunit ribosomal protein L21
MYAVIKTGGQQHKVRHGEVLRIQKLEVGIGEAVEFDDVLVVANDGKIKLGEPFLKGVTVKAEVVDQARDKKIRIIKFRRRKQSMTKQGHRQYYTAIRITEIDGVKSEVPATAKVAEKPVAETAETKAPAKPVAAKSETKAAAPKKAEAKKPAATTEAKKTAAKKPVAKKTESKK